MINLSLLLVAMSALHGGAATDDLQSKFLSPPDNTKPRCYWYWMDGHITKEGITKDLEMMRRVGIGEGYIGVISGQSGLPATPDAAKALSDEWWGFIEHAVREGTRLGVDIGLFNSPGWSQSGGPWVTPQKAMRYVTLPEKRLTGPQHFEGKLPVPQGDFQDIAVLAFPVPEGEGVVAKETARTPNSITFELPEPFTARSITVYPIQKVKVTAELQSSTDGQQFTTVKKFDIDRHNLEINVGPVPLAPIVASFPATAARYFKLTLSEACELGEVQLSPAARVESYAEKTLVKMFQDPLPPFDFYSWAAQPEVDAANLAVKPETVVNLTSHMSPDGTLKWDVPAGDWIVLRTAMTPTGTKNSPSPPEATGLEVDKMNRAALKTHFDSYVGELLRRIPASERTAWKHVVADSYEMGPQNWTDDFAADFSSRYGYDPMPWMPVLTGRIVGSADQSNRFLWDMRRMVADRVAKDYVGGLRDLCNEAGLKMWLENYGHWGYPSEFLKYGGYCDEISGEFWVEGSLGTIELRDAASAAHIYGKPIVWAEAFTGGPAFVNTPRDFKARGDWAFCEGINQFVLHVVIHQPWDDKKPGINAPW
ncbi:MAG: glycoside hydrolase family 2, partial [Candidatus Hydrogenedentes bacterium]|nr:glycoside hydrolase family 2 [Candidatus Hydrogenedentota bacterium]